MSSTSRRVGFARRTTFASSLPPRGLPSQFIEGDLRERGAPFSFKARALAQVALPCPGRSAASGQDDSRIDGRARTTVRYWVESHGADFPFALPKGLEWIEARVDGRIVDRVDFDQSKSQYRLRFPGDAVSRPALVELDLQDADASADRGLAASRAQGRRSRASSAMGGAAPLEHGARRYSAGLVRRESLGLDRPFLEAKPWKGISRPERVASGSDGLPRRRSTISPDQAATSQDRYLFSRRGQPTELKAWIVPGIWLVGICSGFTLVIGFLAIFLRLRFRTIWLVVAVVAVLAAVLVEPTVTFLVLQAAALGAVLTLVGLLIERSIERSSLRCSSSRAWRGGRRSGPPPIRR